MKLACRKQRRYVKIKSEEQRESDKIWKLLSGLFDTKCVSFVFYKQTSTIFYYDLKWQESHFRTELLSPRYEADDLLKLLYVTEGFYLKIDDFWKKNFCIKQNKYN